MTAEATILHFYIKYPSGQWISIPKQTYIQDTKGGEKLFVTKAEGIPLVKKYTMPENGEVQYQLYFPKLSNTVNTIDYGEANEGGSWMIYDIVVNETKESSLLPKELLGNWLQTDGSNQWDYGFYTKNAIVDKSVWNYKTVEKEKKYFVIVLERNGKQRTVYAQIDKKRGTSFGSDKLQMKSYSTTKTENPNYKLPNDEPYSEMVFKTDSATYSGVIKNYSPRAGKKTGTISVDNVFTGNQDSYLLKIADDGSFSVKFPINHPQSIWVRLPYFNDSVFVEPGKETFHLADANNSLFMGDCARINTDLYLDKQRGESYAEYQKLRSTILETTSQDFKNSCLSIKNKQIETLNNLIKKQFLSQKAIQIRKLDIEFLAFKQMLSYEMNRMRVKEQDNSKTLQNEGKPAQEYKLDAAYYDFITEPILKNEIAVVSDVYYTFINRLRSAEILQNGNAIQYSYNSIFDNVDPLQKSGITFNKEELQMIGAGKKLEKINRKYFDFLVTNSSKIEDFKKNHIEASEKLRRKNPKILVSVGDLAEELKSQAVVLTAAENELLAVFKSSELTKEELELQKKFNDKYAESLKSFIEKYKTNIQEIDNDRKLQELKESNERNFQQLNAKLNEVFGVKEAFVYDVCISQDQLGKLEKELVTFSDEKVKSIQEKIKHPFISNYIETVNNKVKAKNEANKKETGFTVNEVKKTEGDELFEAMIAKFKGKVIYVDFWATWCGPCLQGIKEIAPLKEDMKNENVVFLYITNQTSPENTWKNSIPNIKGEHNRVSEDEWNYLKQKFNISGIPHYVLVDKKGEIINPKLGHNSNESLKGILEKQMK